jgi:hypothetical protein
MAEKWVQIQGFEGFYEVSDMGNVRSVERTVERLRYGKIEIIPYRAMPVKQRVNYKGYCDLILQRDGKRKTLLVHRLVAAAFCETNGGDQVNHMNSLRHDNRAENLEWCTGKENVAHAMENHPGKWGKKAICALKDGRIVFTFESAREAERNGFHAGNISSALNGRLRTTGGFEWMLRSDLEALGAID